MYNVEIRRPRKEDMEELSQFFQTVVEDTFTREGLAELQDDIRNEIESKKQYIKIDINSNGVNRYFLIAIDKISNKVVGTIEYGTASELMNDCTNQALKGINEVGKVLVHPDFQGKESVLYC